MAIFNSKAFESARKEVFGLGKAAIMGSTKVGKTIGGGIVKTMSSMIPKKKKKVPAAKSMSFGAQVGSNIKSHDDMLRKELSQ